MNRRTPNLPFYRLRFLPKMGGLDMLGNVEIHQLGGLGLHGIFP